MKYKGYLITHTHWDREWYLSLEIYRFRLYEVFERIQAILAANPGYHSFYLDGQTLPVEDYLEARGEDAEKVKSLIASGRLRIGPFYTLLDEQLVSGESFVRNLMMGMQDVEKYGGRASIGYLPDNFGHVSQTPQILAGFGIETAVLMRGILKDSQTPNEGYWRGADGTRVKALLLNSGYSSFCRADPADPATFSRAFHSVRELKSRARFGALLFMHGVDHSLPQPDIAGVIAATEKKFPDVEIIHTDFESFVEAIPWDEVDYEIVGEQIRTPLLDGTFSSRMGLKRLNRQCESELSGCAEPLSTIAWLNGSAYPDRDLNRAWRLLVQAHPHDSITGCHTDVVADDIHNRLRRSLEISSYLSGQGLDALVGERYHYQDPAESRTITIFNPSPHERLEVIRLVLFTPLTTDLIRKIVVRCGTEVYEAALVEMEEVSWPRLSEYGIPEKIPHKRLTVEFGPVRLDPFALNLLSYELITGDNHANQFLDAVAVENQMKPAGSPSLYSGAGRLENDFLCVEVGADGMLDVTDKTSGRRYHRLHRIEAEMDSGNLYAFAPLLKRSRYYFTPLSMGLEEDLPTSASVRVSGFIEAPAGIDDDMRPLAEKARCGVDVFITLKKGDPILYFHTVLDNQLQRVCLRAVFDSGMENAGNHVHTPFDVVERAPLSDSYRYVDKRRIPNDVNRYCAQSFTSISDGDAGFAVLNRGMPEYTFHRNGALTLTLLRASNLLWGTSPLDCPLHEYSAENGNEPGRWEREYGLLFHRGFLLDSEFAGRAFDYNLPIYNRLYSQPAVSCCGMSFNSETLVLSAFKRSEAADGVILRFFNALDTVRPAGIRFERKLLRALRCRLDETPHGGELPLKETGHLLEMTVKPKEIVTLKLFFA